MSVLSSLLARSAGRWYFRRQLQLALRGSGQSLCGADLRWQPLYQRWLSGGRRAAPAMLARALLPLDAPARWAAACSRLLPVIAARQAHANAEAAALPWAQPLGQTLEIGLCSGPAGSRVLQGQLQQWGVSGEQALQCALANLARHSPPRWTELRPGLLRASWQDDFDSARLLLPHLLQQWPLAGSALILVSARGTLLLAGTEAVALDAALAAELESTQRSRPQAVELLCWEAGCWRVWRPGRCWPRLRRALSRLQVTAWERQKEQLDQATARDGSPPAAEVFVLPDSGGSLRTGCSWVNGFPGLLPASDLVLLVSDAEDFSGGSVHRWQDVLARLGHHLQPCGLQPERWRTTGFPSPAELAALPPRQPPSV